MRTTRKLDGALPERTGHGGVVLYGGGDQFGGNKEFGHTGDRLLAILGGWVADDLAELVTGSIYRENGRWPRIWTRRAAVGGGEEYWRA
jgi:hypothetical protein